LPLPWFRRKKEDGEQAPLAAAAPAAPAEPTHVEPRAESPAFDGTAPDVAVGEAGATTPKKRRRGSRGGKGRKKPAAAAGAASETAAEARPAAPKEPRPERKPREPRTKAPRQSRARSAPRRAPLPKAKRELLVSVDAGEKRVAVLEDGIVAEVYLERPEQRSIAGNVYLGTVDNVLPGMEAAFVEIGLEKNGFLYVDEIVGPELEGRRGARKIQDLIQKGETILVQAVKDPMKTKGARLTTEISLPGRFVVYVPHGDGLGVSRRLDDEERNRLKSILKEIAPAQGGVIVRTAAEGASAEDVARDLDFLQRLWQTIEARAKTAKAPSLIYQEAELPLRVTRDLFTGDFERLLVDHDRTYKRVVGYLKKTSPHMVERVTRYKEREPLLEAFGVEQEIRSTLNRRVDLPSGGYLIFDYAEAFTVIDVNTGRFVGSRSKKGGTGRLEDTITKNNLEAVKEVVRQLRLRDVGGIIVIDFIDMANPKNRAAVEEALRHELERDRTKTYVVEISPLGLVEMTRQNVTDGPREVMTRKCPTCDGDGIIVSEETTAVELERKLRGLITPGSRAKAYKVEVNARIAAMLAGPGGKRLQELQELTKRQFFLVGLNDVHLDHFHVLDRGDAERLAPEAPVAVGEEVEVKLGEVGLYDPHAGVGRVKGVEVIVGAAAPLVGKKVRVRVTALMEGAEYAELVDQAGGPEPITAEAEAEKPTRAARLPKARKDEVEPEVEAEVEVDEVEAEGEEPEAEAEADGAATPKKRTRRGTRGGRNRRKKTAVAAGGEADADAEADAEAEEPVEAVDAETEEERELPAGPVIHVPERDLGDEAEENGDGTATARRKTRRGNRGGRNRKRRAAGATATAEAPAEAAEDELPSQNGAEPAPADEDWSYTPMSEWGDLDRGGR